MGESFQDYSWIQDFGFRIQADFTTEIIKASFIYF